MKSSLLSVEGKRAHRKNKSQTVEDMHSEWKQVNIGNLTFVFVHHKNTTPPAIHDDESSTSDSTTIRNEDNDNRSVNGKSTVGTPSTYAAATTTAGKLLMIPHGQGDHL
eukprot:scaffold5048_cov167-Alexandrium_tamarense.AAC.2